MRRACLCLAAVMLLCTVPNANAALAADAFDTSDSEEPSKSGDAMVEVTEEDDDEENPAKLVFDKPIVLPTSAAEVFGTNIPGLRLEVHDVDGRFFKITLRGADDLLKVMQEQLKDEDVDYFFRYKLSMNTEHKVDLSGKLIFRVPKRGEEARITKLATSLRCKNLTYKSKHPRIEKNSVSWLVAMPKWIDFSLDKVDGFEFSVYNAYDTRQKIIYNFNTADITTDTLFYKVLRKSGVLRVEVPNALEMILTITDPKLVDGYVNASQKPGAIEPYYHIKAINDAKAWTELKISYQKGQDLNGMDFYAGEYHRLPDDSNKYNATSSPITDCSYKIEGDKLTIRVKLPEECGFGFPYLQQIAIDMNNGTVLQNNIYNIY